MKKIRKANERGSVNLGWLEAKHSFSFGSYCDPAYMGFKSLRVINNDIIESGKGFDTHPHKDMEIITFVLKGKLEHRDTLGNHSIIIPGEIQIMSAGKGIFHSEFNPCETNTTELYQIWIKPQSKGGESRYEQYSYLDRIKLNDIIPLIQAEGGDQIARINQAANLYFGKFELNKSKKIELNCDKAYWIQILEGKFEIDQLALNKADGLSIENEVVLEIGCKESGEFLLFELE